MRYWDSSALVPLFIHEPRSEIMHKLASQDPGIVSWWGTPVECLSALWRFRRSASLKEAEIQIIRSKIDALVENMDVINPSSLLRDRALRLLALHPLRAGDSLQLASGLIWTQDQPRHVKFVCLDDKLRQAALTEGFHMLPEENILL